jgi:hypothetical protein
MIKLSLSSTIWKKIESRKKQKEINKRINEGLNKTGRILILELI